MSTVGSTVPAGSGGGLHHEIHEAITQMELLKVSELKAICRSIELPITGRKAILQDRIRAYLKNSCSIGRIDPWRPKTIRILIEKSKAGQALPKYEMLWQAIRSGAFNHPVATGHLPVSSLQEDSMIPASQTNHSQRDNARSSDLNLAMTHGDVPMGSKKTYLHFKESPFYKIRKLIPETAQRINITNVRGVCTCKFKFTKAEWSLLESDKKYRLYLFCGAANPTGAIGNEPIQFPHPNEIRFNGAQVKDNVRGLKNKLGTAKPADLTPFLRPSPQQNVLEIVYAFTKNEYYTYCYIVEEISPEELLRDVLKHPKILKVATLHYIKQTLSEEEEDDLVTTSTVMSLQCPVSYTRMKYPVKSIMCRHLQCFDSLWYIYSQMQIPTWQCPVCQIDIDLKSLAICEYVDEILKNSSEEVEQVELSSDGSWTPVIEETPKPNEKPVSHTIVKTENSNDDYDNVPLSRQQIPTEVSSHSNEPIIISLDSDVEDEAEIDDRDNAERNNAFSGAPERQASTIDGEGSQSIVPQSRAYMDSSTNESEQTLDPRAQHALTPINTRRRSDRAEDSINYRTLHVPNMLDKTPLNNTTVDHDSSLRDAEASSPTPSALITDLFASDGGPALNVDARSGPIINNHNASSEHFNSSAALSSNLSGGEIPNGPGSSSNSILGLTGNPAAPPLPPMYHQAHNQDERSILGTAEPDLPILPPLPEAHVSQDSSRGAMGSANNGNGSTNGLVHGRGKRPIVSPFIPKKPYLSILPQKRHISNSSRGSPPLQSSSMAGMNHDNEGNGEWVSPMDNPSASRDEGVIDLTSD